jgi:hypothetical protein
VQHVQSLHAVLHLALEHAGICGIPNIVLIGVPDVRALDRVQLKLRDAGITFFHWDEPDDDLGFTAIATVPIRGPLRDVLKNYRILKHGPREMLAYSPTPAKNVDVGSNPTGTTRN